MDALKGYFLVNKIGFKAAEKIFSSEKEAKEYKKKYKHAPAIENAKIVKGRQDEYGMVYEEFLYGVN